LTTILETLVTNASPAINVFSQNPFLALSTKIANVYGEALQQHMAYLSASSARIIQEQAVMAWTQAAQSCSKALAENALASQQQAIARIADANRKAFGMLASDFSPFKMQPMAGFTNWLPALPHALPHTPDSGKANANSRRVK
jgi:polyhydroxyalkanoate synthesis regulator protein